MDKDQRILEAVRVALAVREEALKMAITQVAEAVGNPAPSQEEVVAFFHSFIDGDWNPFEEATAHTTAEARKLDADIVALDQQICQLLGEQYLPTFDHYEALMNRRLTAEFDHAYLVGYQTAIRFLLMGILPLRPFFRTEDRRSGDVGSVKKGCE